MKEIPNSINNIISEFVTGVKEDLVANKSFKSFLSWQSKKCMIIMYQQLKYNYEYCINFVYF